MLKISIFIMQGWNKTKPQKKECHRARGIGSKSYFELVTTKKTFILFFNNDMTENFDIHRALFSSKEQVIIFYQQPCNFVIKKIQPNFQYLYN